jgi:hypothetical protein
MNPITRSSIFYDEYDQLVLVTQGLIGYTLVANKKILFRLYLDVSALSCAAVLATITYRILGMSIQKSILIPTASLLIEPSSPNGPSVGILFTGDVFPYPAGSWLHYDIDFYVYGAPGWVPHFRIPDLVFLAPGRLRLLIHNLFGRNPQGGNQITPNFSWLVDMFQSLERLSAMLPVKDGLKFGLTHQDVGLTFIYGDNIDTWPAICPSGLPGPGCTKAEMIQLNMAETQQINASGTVEHVDATVSWRQRDFAIGEQPGGSALYYDVAPGNGLALVVGGNWNGKENTGPVMAQEIGHLFGLEPKDSPHFEDPRDGLHSKDPGHFDPFAFDFYLVKPYQPPAFGFVGDVMNNLGGGVWQGRDMVLYNAWDWEHLRQRLSRLVSSPRMMAGEDRPDEQQEELVAALDRMYADEPAIEVANRERGMGYGFEGVRLWLEDLGVKNVYVTVGDRPSGKIIHPRPYLDLHRKQPDVFDWPETREAKTTRQ